jgi:hypothetical protein
MFPLACLALVTSQRSFECGELTHELLFPRSQSPEHIVPLRELLVGRY